ncbi:AarF/UbiB family protein [Cytobacillus oceanisediminis]|uniref:AarF/UbiB family protein n=1 Tax=Cytobacillus oceanisediminis TaxID=665099 RepID=UPI0023D9CEC9|nr:AarF/UbiB family protein [Cytobacillus oceanisediminis]MDF2036843.1 AarF/UbiB family protein [Cytobacillus oceanisediminis]
MVNIDLKKIKQENDLVGFGAQGKVYKLPPGRCIKIYKKKQHAAMEATALRAAAGSRFFPKLYEAGSDYIVMEYIEGETLDDYLKKNGQLSKELIKEIVKMLKEMEKLNFTRVDARFRHIIVTQNNKIKVIDHVNGLTYNVKYPVYLFKGLKKVGYFQSFLEEVNKLDQDLSKRWRNEMEKAKRKD